MGCSASKTVVVISGPSGVGKTTLCAKLIELERRLKPVIAATTRSPRPGELNGKDYYFISEELFRLWIKRGELIEHTELFGDLYGTPRKSVEEIITEGNYPVLRIDVQGARSLKNLGYQGVFVFILPPNLETLKRRLEIRQTRENNLTERLAKARKELTYKDEYDFRVVNDNFSEAIAQLRKILKHNLFAE